MRRSIGMTLMQGARCAMRMTRFTPYDITGLSGGQGAVSDEAVLYVGAPHYFIGVGRRL